MKVRIHVLALVLVWLLATSGRGFPTRVEAAAQRHSELLRVHGPAARGRLAEPSSEVAARQPV